MVEVVVGVGAAVVVEVGVAVGVEVVVGVGVAVVVEVGVGVVVDLMDPVKVIEGIVAKSGTTPPPLKTRPAQQAARMSEATVRRLIFAHAWATTDKAKSALS